MRKSWTAIALGGAAAAAAAQVQIHAPGMRSPTGHGHHGAPVPAELAELAVGGYLRRVVQTRGTLTPLDPGGEFFELPEGGKWFSCPSARWAMRCAPGMACASR